MQGGSNQPPDRPLPERPITLSVRTDARALPNPRTLRPNHSSGDLADLDSPQAVASGRPGSFEKTWSMPSESAVPSPKHYEMATSPEGLGEGWGRWEQKRKDRTISFVASPPPAKDEHDSPKFVAAEEPVGNKIEKVEGHKGSRTLMASPLPVAVESSDRFNQAPPSGTAQSKHLMPDFNVGSDSRAKSGPSPEELISELQVVDEGRQERHAARVVQVGTELAAPVHQISGTSFDDAIEADHLSSDSVSEANSHGVRASQKFQPGGRHVVFISSLSAGSRAIDMLLNEGSVDVERRIVDMLSGEHLSPEFLALNPKQNVPVLVINDERGGSNSPSTLIPKRADSPVHSEEKISVLTEASSIMRYLCQSYPTLHSWYPTDPRVRMKIDEYLDWHLQNIRGICSSLLTNAIFMKSNTRDKAVLDKAAALLTEKVALFETAWLPSEGSGSYICGPEPTIADLIAASDLETPQILGIDLSCFLTLESWRERLQARGAFVTVHKALQATLKLYRIPLAEKQQHI